MANRSAASGGAAAGLKVGIIGGSIAGCTAAVELLRAGCEVRVLERSTGHLEDRGAGIGLAQSLIETLQQRDLIDADMPYDPYTTLSRVARSEDGREASDAGRELMAMPAAGVTTSWGILYQQLRARVPACVYASGCEVTDLWEPSPRTSRLRPRCKPGMPQKIRQEKSWSKWGAH